MTAPDPTPPLGERHEPVCKCGEPISKHSMGLAHGHGPADVIEDHGFVEVASPPLPTAGEPTLAALCAEVEAALAKATPGPWVTQRWNGELYVAGQGASLWDGQGDLLWGDMKDSRGEPNAVLIASAPTWLARLVDGVREMEAGLLQEGKLSQKALARLAVAERRIGRLDEPYVDERGESWLAPTAFAYAKACAEVTALRATLADAEKDARRGKWLREHADVTLDEDGGLVAYIWLRDATDDEVDGVHEVGLVRDQQKVAAYLDEAIAASPAASAPEGTPREGSA